MVTEEKLKIRFFVSVPRSGSTLFMRIMAQNSNLGVTSRLILMGNSINNKFIYNREERRSFNPDYRIFCSKEFRENNVVSKKAVNLGKHTLISKEEVGNNKMVGTDELNEFNFKIFPNDDSIILTKPIFGFRHPVRVFDSWKKRGWNDISSFIQP